MHSTEFVATHFITAIRLLTTCKHVREEIINSYYYTIFHIYIIRIRFETKTYIYFRVVSFDRIKQ